MYAEDRPLNSPNHLWELVVLGLDDLARWLRCSSHETRARLLALRATGCVASHVGCFGACQG